jgi:hypothetical protein
MATTPFWQRSKSERAAAFATAFAGIAPAEQKTPTLAQQLRAIRPLILAKRREGYNVDQICASLKHPDIGIDASAPTVRRMIREADRKAELRRKARIAALMPKPVSTAAPTGTPVPMPRATTRA